MEFPHRRRPETLGQGLRVMMARWAENLEETDTYIFGDNFLRTVMYQHAGIQGHFYYRVSFQHVLHRHLLSPVCPIAFL